MSRRLRVDIVDDDAVLVFVLNLRWDFPSDDFFEERRHTWTKGSGI